MKDAAKKGDIHILHYVLKHERLNVEEREKFYREIVAIITPHKFSQFLYRISPALLHLSAHV